MNNNLSTTGGSELSKTGNPQNIGGQELSATATNLQQTQVSVLNQQGLKITSVGSSQFKSVTLPVQSTQPTTSTNSTSLPAPFLWGLGIALLAIIALVVLAVKKGQKPAE